MPFEKEFVLTSFFVFAFTRIIGQRWKNIDPDRLSKFSELAANDTERYKTEMQEYNGRQEAKMRSELKASPAPYSSVPSSSAALADRTSSQFPDMRGYSMYGGGPAGSYDVSAYGLAAGVGGYAPGYSDYGAYGMGMNAYGMPEGKTTRKGERMFCGAFHE